MLPDNHISHTTRFIIFHNMLKRSKIIIIYFQNIKFFFGRLELKIINSKIEFFFTLKNLSENETVAAPPKLIF